MEEVLDVYARPYDSRYPVQCMDEQPIQLLKETRTPIAGTKKHPRRVDYEYELFLFAGENRYDGHSGLPDEAIARLSQGLSQGLIRGISAGKS